MTIRAVLFDVGGPLDTEIIHERLLDMHIREAVTAEGYSVTDDAYTAANRWAIDSFAWNTYQAIMWRLTGGDVEASLRAEHAVAARAPERREARDGIELRPGVAEMLERLWSRGLRLGLAANQPAAILATLDRHGVGRYFHHREVSGTHGIHKPDVRLFLRACTDLGVAPEECVMVGDRIDNDIVPAKVLGMRTVLLRTGRHIAQQPRSWVELPDAEARDVQEMEAGIIDFLD